MCLPPPDRRGCDLPGRIAERRERVVDSGLMSPTRPDESISRT